MNSELKRQWDEEGYIVVKGLFDPERTARLRLICENILARWRVARPATGETGEGIDGTSMRHLNHPGYFAQHPEWFPEIMNAASDTKVLETCRTILDEQPMFRCTSLFMNPILKSEDGNWHRDTQFGAKGDDEAEKKKLGAYESNGIQLQVALVPSEDIEYVPRSHLRWDTPAEYAIRRADGQKYNRSNRMPGAVRLPLEAGDAAAFNPNGLHRGRYHADKLRRTLMLTYTRTSKPCFDFFSNQPWFLEPGHLDPLPPATRAFFEPFVAEYRKHWEAPKPELAAAY